MNVNDNVGSEMTSARYQSAPPIPVNSRMSIYDNTEWMNNDDLNAANLRASVVDNNNDDENENNENNDHTQTHYQQWPSASAINY